MVQELDAAVADGDPAQSTEAREDQAFGQQQPDRRRKRPAPSASRTAISRVRVRARLKRRPATLVHATSSTAERQDGEDRR